MTPVTGIALSGLNASTQRLRASASNIASMRSSGAVSGAPGQPAYTPLEVRQTPLAGGGVEKLDCREAEGEIPDERPERGSSGPGPQTNEVGVGPEAREESRTHVVSLDGGRCNPDDQGGERGARREDARLGRRACEPGLARSLRAAFMPRRSGGWCVRRPSFHSTSPVMVGPLAVSREPLTPR